MSKDNPNNTSQKPAPPKENPAKDVSPAKLPIKSQFSLDKSNSETRKKYVMFCCSLLLICY